MHHRYRRRRFSVEPLECRLALSVTSPAHVIGNSTATASRPHEVGQTSRQDSASKAAVIGDVNGDGKFNLADLQAFAAAYGSRLGDPNYNPAFDFNHNGVINQSDARILLKHMTPLTPDLPLTARLILAPQDQIHYSGPTVLGAATFQKVVTILGHTTPGSLVIEDNNTSRLPGGTQAYKFTGPAHATDASGVFSVTSTNTQGLNNNDFLIVDPFGHRLIIDFPIFWIPYARG
jgi:hypothetical protein